MKDENIPKVKLPSPFRVWLQDKWFEHKEEILTWEKKSPSYNDIDFFRKNKWNLKKMYKEKE